MQSILKKATASLSVFRGKLASLPLKQKEKDSSSSAWVDQCIVSESSFLFVQNVLVKKEKENHQRSSWTHWNPGL